MKAVMIGANSIKAGDNHVVVSGGMENMSQIPHYLPQQRSGLALGHGKVIDGLIHDGLWDAFDGHHMGKIITILSLFFNIIIMQFNSIQSL